MNSSLHAILSVAYKEFLHIYRDKRVLLLLLILPPLFILLFGYAFESSDITDVPGLLVNRDNTPRTQRSAQVSLVRLDPHSFYLPRYIGARGWAGLRLDREPLVWDEVASFLRSSYRMSAPKKLAATV